MTDRPRGSRPAPKDGRRRSSPAVARLMDLAIRAARRSQGRIGLAPPDGAALRNRREDTVRTAAQLDPSPDWSAGRLLGLAKPGADLAVVVEPTADRVDRIRQAGVRRVWLAALHPDPRRRGRFVKKAAGVGLAVTVTDDPRVAALQEIYGHVMRTSRAYVVLKMASSLDGRIATRGGESQWITQASARDAGRRLRAELDAILVGVQTVLADDPQLTARRRGARDPVRLVLDSRLRTPPDARIVQTADRVPTVVFTTRKAPAAARRALEVQRVRVVPLPADRSGRVSIPAVTEWLVDQNLPGLLVEGGGVVHGAFVDAGLVDRLVWFGAPMVLGGEGLPAVAGQGPSALAEALRFDRWQVRRIGVDWMIDLRRGAAAKSG